MCLVTCAFTVISAVLGGCAGTADWIPGGLAAPLNEGPVSGGGGEWGRLCVPSDQAGKVTFSLTTLTNNGSETVTLDKVSAMDLANLTILGIDLVPRDGSGLAGVAGYPPAPHGRVGRGLRWSEMTPAAGAKIQPDMRASVAVGVKLKKAASTGSLSHLTVDYHIGGDRYRLETGIEFVVPPVGAKCSAVRE